MDNAISILQDALNRAQAEAENLESIHRASIQNGLAAQRAVDMAKAEVAELESAVAELTRAQRRSIPVEYDVSTNEETGPE